MGGTAFLVIAGSLFVLLGRWMYRHPTKVYPHWVGSAAKGQFFRKFFRGFGLVIIFAGSYSAIVAVASIALSPILAVALAVIAGLLAAYLLRPRLSVEPRAN